MNLDDRWLPVAARRVRAWADRVQALRDRTRAAGQSMGADALDERYGDLRPFAVLRDKPPVGLLLSGAVLAAAVAVAVAEESERARERQPVSAAPVPPGIASTALGPKVGDSTDAYIAHATETLRVAVSEAAGEPRVALVSFKDYRTAEQATSLMEGFMVRRVYLRATAAGDRAAPLPVDIRASNLLEQIRRAYSDTARNRAMAQKAYQSYVDTLSGTSTRDKAFRELYAAFARSSEVEAREFGRGCACVYGVVVEAPPAELLTLRARLGIRAVEVAGRGLDASDVQVQPLQPEITGVVPRPTFGSKH